MINSHNRPTKEFRLIVLILSFVTYHHCFDKFVLIVKMYRRKTPSTNITSRDFTQICQACKPIISLCRLLR
ncbi:unnamed protein product [Rhizophagus irregularis]|nr:unnamed protein product [Rhizophagus irregularis]CAB5351564.1 unnamed protein product [Rhizophagus irregularis]